MSSVSVVIAAYNAQRYLEQAILSVLAQTHAVSEVIVVDDGSTDDTPGVAHAHCQVRYLRLDHAGQATAQNLGVSLTTHPYLAFLDADDLWESHKISLQIRYLEDHSDVDMVFGHAEEFYDLDPTLTSEPLASNSKGCPHSQVLGLRPPPPRSPPSARQASHGGDTHPSPLRKLRPCLRGPAKVPGTMLIRRASLERVGPFDPALPIGAGIDWYARARDAGLKEWVLDAVVLKRRIHYESFSFTHGSPADYAGLVRGILKRRRGQI